MFITKKTYSKMIDKYAAVVDNNEKLGKQIGIALEDIRQLYTGPANADNPYTTKASQVEEIHSKYKGSSKVGNMILQRIVDLRVAFSVPNRLFLTESNNVSYNVEETRAAKDFLKAFMAENYLDSSLPRDLAKEAELEGEVAISLNWDTAKKLPIIKYYPRSITGYKISPVSKFAVNSKLRLTFTQDGSNITIEDANLCYIAFHDKLNDYVGYPTCGSILKTIENIDMDLRDWRKLNHLFGHPTPHFKCETQDEANEISEQIAKTGWKVGTAIATNSAFTLVGPSGVEGNLLMMSIQTGAKIISGHTGIGIHFLGFANVMSNRATADSMGEPTEVVLHSEITSWQRFYYQLFVKAIDMRNKKLNSVIKVDAVSPKIIPLTDRQWSIIKDIYQPAVESGLISHRTFLDKMPDIDAETELAKLEEEDAKARKTDKRSPTNKRAGKDTDNSDKEDDDSNSNDNNSNDNNSNNNNSNNSK